MNKLNLNKLYINEKLEIKNTYVEGNKVWYVQTLIDATKGFPVKTLSINKIDLHTKIEWTLNTYFDLKNHIIRIRNAQLKYPVIVGPKDILLDGYHRLMKAIDMKKSTLKYVKLDKMPPHDFIK